MLAGDGSWLACESLPNGPSLALRVPIPAGMWWLSRPLQSTAQSADLLSPSLGAPPFSPVLQRLPVSKENSSFHLHGMFIYGFQLNLPV